ncbi:tautomerase family protein [Leuconostocaceae bacterium ESL0723]|nr:tautomerase family protein [Lactobacillaceae bacterium L1_55_11]WEV54585.1 tautomerase family protein [Leuconostocaceae bacterium ESL0723]
MPLIKVDILKGRTEGEIRGILDAIHEAVLVSFKVPDRDRYQVVTQHDPDEMIIEDTGLGYPRTDKVTVISITSKKRSEEAVRTLYKEIVTNLSESGLVPPEDVMINITFNETYSWSFGRGEVMD